MTWREHTHEKLQGFLITNQDTFLLHRDIWGTWVPEQQARVGLAGRQCSEERTVGC